MLKLHLFSKRRLRGDLIEVYKIVKDFSRLVLGNFFQYAEQGSTKYHRSKLFNFNLIQIRGWYSFLRELLMTGTI